MYWYKDSGTDYFRQQYQKSNSLAHKIKKKFVILIFFTILLLLLFLLISGVNYMDVPNACYIRIKDNVVSGDKKSITKALQLLREKSFLEYKNVCRYANTIYERKCLVGNDLTPALAPAPTDGCYILGTKAIFIDVASEYSDELVEIRMRQIQKYADMASNYWLMKIH